MLTRALQRRQNVRRAARGRQCEQNVAAAAEPFELTREHLLETVVIADCRQRRSVGGQRDRGIGRAIFLVAADDFSGDVLGVGGAAAVTCDQELVAGTQAGRDDVGDLSRGVEQVSVRARALKRVARQLQMRGNRVFRGWAQASPFWLRWSW